MTTLEKAIANSLRLSDAAAEKLLDTIHRNVETARAELIRSGISPDIANSDAPLVEDAIITFCMIRMGDEELQNRYQRSFEYQQENLRKSL